MDKKYWYLSYNKRYIHSSIANDGRICGATVPWHPFKAIKQWNETTPAYQFIIISFQEITKEEFDLYDGE